MKLQADAFNKNEDKNDPKKRSYMNLILFVIAEIFCFVFLRGL